MRKSRKGRILNVSSLASFCAGPYMSVYYASKSFVRSFSEALSEELKPYHVTVTALCPGPVATGFEQNAGLQDSRMFKMLHVSDAASVARAGYVGMMKGKALVYYGWQTKAASLLSRMCPRMVTRKLMGVTAIATVLGLPLAFLMPSMRRKMGMKKMVIYGFAFSALGYLLIFFAGGNMILVIVAGLITSIGVVPFTMMFNIFIVDCADYNEFKGIPRMEGTMGSLTGLAGKIGSAFGGFILGILMSLSGYDGTAAVQTDAALLMIRMLASIVPLIIFAVIILLLRKYSLDEEMQAVRNAAKEGEQS